MKNKLKVVVCNARPRSGKDEVAKHMMRVINTEGSNYTCYQRAFKDELFKVAANIVGITVDELLEGYDLATEEAMISVKNQYKRTQAAIHYHEVKWFKDVPLYTVGDKTLSTRELLIHASENVAKPLCGDDVFGKALTNNLPEEGLVIVTDSGFVRELLPVIEKVGKENVLVLRLHRKLDNDVVDSRKMLLDSDFDDLTRPVFINIENNGTLEEFHTKVEQEISQWLNQDQ